MSAPGLPRAWGLVPLGFFLLSVHHYAGQGNLPGLLWLCHLSNLALALGIFVGHPGLVRLTTLFLVAVVPPWLLDGMIIRVAPTPAALLTHLGGAAVGLCATRAMGSRRGTWRPTLAWFLCAQLVARLTTEPALNINFAHRIWFNWEWLFPHYRRFWIVSTIGLALWLKLVELGVLELIPPPGEPEAA